MDKFTEVDQICEDNKDSFNLEQLPCHKRHGMNMHMSPNPDLDLPYHVPGRFATCDD